MSDDFEAFDLSEFTDDDFAAIDAHVARLHPAGPAIQVAVEPSPFHQFLSWKKHLAVTDLVGPLWCEVQYEYGLYGRRYKPLHLRPTVFTSRNGNQIRVHQQVARINDRRLKRGKSVHKALEDELRPDKKVVHVVSEEERFGLRLVQLIDGFSQLVSDGITRELPVFTITHAQVVLGVIDEVLWSPLPLGTQDQAILSRSPSSARCDSPLKKKQRLQEISRLILDLPTETCTKNTDNAVESAKEPSHAIPTCDQYELRIIDYKTRRSLDMPSDEDTLSPRLQLMMYHRMLSCLLKPEAFNFDLLWSRLDLNPTKPFSAQFLQDIVWEQRRVDPMDDGDVHLGRLVSEWISVVQHTRPGLVGVSRRLQIVYRRSVFVGKRREKGKHRVRECVDVDDPVAALVLQEELDLARAIEESLNETGDIQQQVGTSFVGGTSAVQEDLTPLLDARRTDHTLAWATEQSLLTCVHEERSKLSENEDGDLRVDGMTSAANASTVDMSPIIGMKEFGMSDDELDVHLADVLRWWFGARPARGVGVNQTNRCLGCEYQDSCEWRECKAREVERWMT